jgi:uncharacterized membrane protein (UPF0182 family)
VRFGNLLTLPVGGGLLYVEPVYVQAATSTAFPLLRKVLVQFGENVAFEDTLQEALDSVFSGDAGAVTGDAGGAGGGGGGGGGAEQPANNPELRRALADAERALQASQTALAKGDFAAYGEAQQQLKDAIARAVAAQGSASSPSPSASPSASGSSSSSPSPSGSGSGSAAASGG